MIVYSKKKQADAKGGGRATPMALPINSTIKDFAQRIHKDFVKNFRFARISRGGRAIQAGLSYKLQDNDVVEIYAN